MKQLKWLLVTGLCLCLLLTGCIQGVSAAESAVEEQDGAEPAQAVYGKIKEINGNEILLALGEYGSEAPGFDSRDGSGGASPDGEAADNPDQPGAADLPERGDGPPDSDGQRPERGEMPAGDRDGQGPPAREAGVENAADSGTEALAVTLTAAGGDFAMPEGGPPDGGRGGESGQRGGRESGGNDMPGGIDGGSVGGGMSRTFRLTGEEATYLIPVTATITTGQGDSAKTVKFTQLAVKNVIRLNLDEAGNILSVEVLE